MSFDADAFAAAREPWTVTLNGRVHVARPVSVAHVLTFQGAVTRAKGDPVQTALALTALLRVAFPPRWSYLLPGRDPVRAILALDHATQSALLTDFFVFLARTLTPAATRKTPPSPPRSEPTPPQAMREVEGVAV